MNDVLDSVVDNKQVRDSLRRQSNMYTAMDALGKSAMREGSNIIVRAWDRALKLLPLRGQFNNTMATFTGLGGLGASAAFAPAFTTIAIGAGTGWLAGRLVTSPTTQKFLGHLLKGMDEAIAVSRGDRALVQQLMTEREELEALINSSEIGLKD